MSGRSEFASVARGTLSAGRDAVAAALERDRRLAEKWAAWDAVDPVEKAQIHALVEAACKKAKRWRC